MRRTSRGKVRFISLLVAGALIALGLTACGAEQQVGDPASQQEGARGPSALPSAEPVWPDSLVVYYSATGTTEEVAEKIARATGGHTFAIVPSEPYTSADLDYGDPQSRVSREYGDETLREVPLESLQAPSWDAYGTVFIGYPIWWGEAAWPVSSFVAANDFAGKTVVPFCTSASSGVGDSGRALAALAGTGQWLDGMRFAGDVGQDEVDAWVSSLDLWAD